VGSPDNHTRLIREATSDVELMIVLTRRRKALVLVEGRDVMRSVTGLGPIGPGPQHVQINGV
jgi:hypothetical protein